MPNATIKVRLNTSRTLQQYLLKAKTMTKNNFSGKYGRSLINGGLIASFVFALAACNTVQGVGRDVQGAGSALERTANRNQPGQSAQPSENQ